MIFPLVLLSYLLLAKPSLAEDQVASLPTCPLMTNLPKYHAACNRAWQNDPAHDRQRHIRHAALGKANAYPHIPTQRTVVCPLDPMDLSSDVVGQDTRWIVENKSSGSVVIAYLKNGVEYSAMNTNITPPQADPRAILQPGEFKVVHAFEGHVFYVREVTEDGSTGDVLLQHRPGIVEFTNRFGKELDCGAVQSLLKVPDQEVDQAEQEMDASDHGAIDNADTDALANDNTKNAASQTPIPSNFKRNPNKGMKLCNMVYLGFRNTLPNCPLDVYYAGVEQGIADGPMQCAEKFKLHLGNEQHSSTMDWESSLKYEATFIGHTFVARLKSNPDVVVDSFTLQPTEIHDCPSRKQKVETVEQVVELNGIQHVSANLQNSTMIQHMDSLCVDMSNNVYVNAMSA